MRDPGAQVERTTLAWERTALSGLACSLVIAKLIGVSFPVPAAFVALIGVGTTAVVLVQARRRFHEADLAFSTAGRLPDARSTAALAGLVSVTGLGAMIYALTVGRLVG